MNSKEELLKYSPPNGYNTQFGQNLKLENIQLNDKLKDMFLDTLLLSEEAKLFGLARAVQETNHFIKSNLDLFIDIVCMMSCYIYCYSKNRQFKMQLLQRRKMYAGAIVVFTTKAIASRFFLYRFLDYIVDKKACQMGLDCSEGSQEFYEKLIVRNKFLRNLIDDGLKL